jgi:hypothetical protein
MFLRIVGLLTLQTQSAVHAASSSNGWLGAALLLAALAAPMRDAVRRAACSSCLNAALLLAPAATSMREAVLCAN